MTALRRRMIDGWGLDPAGHCRRNTSTAKRFSCVPSMFDSLGVQVPYTT